VKSVGGDPLTFRHRRT